MVNVISTSKEQSLYVKVGNFPGLYRNTVSGRYYGSKKLRGKRRDVSLRTTDGKIAERRLREWMRNLSVVNRDLERTTLAELVQKLVAVSHVSFCHFSAPVF
jgi:hypothetical protein